MYLFYISINLIFYFSIFLVPKIEPAPLYFTVKNVSHPSISLLRRIKVFKASKGFSSPKAPFSMKALQNFFRRIAYEEGPRF